VAADLIRKAIGDGEFRADLDVEVVLDSCFAALSRKAARSAAAASTCEVQHWAGLAGRNRL